MEFLKQIVSEETYLKLSQEIADYNAKNEGKPVKLIDLSSGGYVSTDKYEDLQKQLNSMSKDFESLKKANKGNEDLTAQIKELQEKHAKELDQSRRAGAYRYHTAGFNERQIKLLNGAIDKEKLELTEDGTQFKNWAELTDGVKAEYSEIFTENKPSTQGAGGVPQNGAKPVTTTETDPFLAGFRKI